MDPAGTLFSDQGGTSRAPQQVCMLTISYRGDFELARDLCASVDRFVDPEIEHVLVVPESDLPLFAPLVTGRRRLLAKETVLPTGYARLPLPNQIVVGKFYRRLIRELWRGPAGLVRGWIVQQVLKMSAPDITDRDVIVFADSDIVLVRPVSASLFTSDAGVRLYRVPDATRESAMHREWHTVSARLLELESRSYFGADYIGHLVTWRREVVIKLQETLAESSGKRWDKCVTRERAFSEYILYGIYAEHVRGLADCGHFPTSRDLVHASWHYSLHTPAGLAEFVDGFQPHHVGVAIQSTDRFTLEERRLLVKRMVDPV